LRYISRIRVHLICSVAFFTLLGVTPHRQAPKPVAEQPKIVGSATPTGNQLVDRRNKSSEAVELGLAALA